MRQMGEHIQKYIEYGMNKPGQSNDIPITYDPGWGGY